MVFDEKMQGQIGSFGAYAVELNEKGVASAKGDVNFAKEIIPGLTFKVTGTVDMEAHAALILAGYAVKSSTPIIAYIGKLLQGLDDGAPVSAELVAALQQHAEKVTAMQQAKLSAPKAE